MHGCKYCYADFMMKYIKKDAKWGEFVEPKGGICEVLQKELSRYKKDKVLISTVTDPYQPIEGKAELTRKCLKELAQHQFPVTILTKSPLVMRDIDILKKMEWCEVGISITTDKDEIRNLFEPETPSVENRINTLHSLKAAGLKTFAFIGPVLPMNPRNLAVLLKGSIDKMFIDKMNYINKTNDIYKSKGLSEYLIPEYFQNVKNILRSFFSR